ncbi:MAG: T9SS type A sorting domain-containing protein, partial [Candidatus Cloacimonetes bacterium]|nr:T9SS type A sorting domain-containing protein [Candidatus Cloacimonadota bacterium]
PDTYGYYCYDDGDTDYYNVPVYDWIEIDPAYGGSGTTIPMNDPGNMGAIQEIDLPFTLKFYGEEYNTITICSNGWLAPGSNGSKSFMNWNIPGPNGPSPMIAPFWDDLKTGSGHVCYFFDPANHYFVVEWSHLQNEYNNAEETFQVIIYDILFYPTTFTDNEFKFQYKVINNVDAGDYSWSINHGQYATVGIEDHTGLRGLEYTFNNTYPTAAKHLQNQMALLFTGPPIAPEEPFLVLNGISISDENGNGNPDYGENIDLTVTVNNLGENAATGVTAQLNSGDEYIEILQDFSELNDINGGSSGSNLTAFNLDIAQNCPNGHPVIFEIEISSNEMVWILNFTLTINAPELNYSHLLINDGDNTILDPGETADMLVYFSNEGAADAYEAVLEISTADTLLTLNSDVFDFGALQAGDTEASFFSVSAHPQSPIGHICTVNWLITAEMGITAEGSFPVVISQVPVMMTEYFTSFPPDGWMIENSENWVQGNSSHAGGSSPEAQFDWYPSGSGEHRLCSMPINTLGSNELILEFKHMVDHFSGDYTLKVQTSGSSNSWHDVITYGAGDMPATQESLTVSTPDVGSEDFRLAFTFSGDSYNIDHWYIDDVILQNGNNTPVGYIAGNVALDGGSGNIADVQVNAGEESVNPNQNGYYIIGIAPGTYTLTGYLPGYGVFTIGNIEVIAIQTVTIDFTLSYLNPPTDLSAEVNENDVTLEWIEPVRYSNKSESTKTPTRSDIVLNNDNSSSQRNFIAYLVYRNDEEIIQLSDPEQTLYTDSDLENGQYSYKISALYSEGESLSTDPVLVEVDYSDTNNDILPVKTELGMNYPNPFNPETVISFSLAETNLTSLYIYNIKGEKIAELVNDTLLPGEYQAIWSGKDDSGNSVPSGIYLYHLNAGKKSFTRKMMLLK